MKRRVAKPVVETAPSFFKPSDVQLEGAIPLTDVFGRAEREIAGALIVLASLTHGDEWKPLTPAMIATSNRKADADKREPFYSMFRNPFAHVDMKDLVGEGYAEFTDLTLENPDAWKTSAVRFTQKGLDAIYNSRWVAK